MFIAVLQTARRRWGTLPVLRLDRDDEAQSARRQSVIAVILRSQRTALGCSQCRSRKPLSIATYAVESSGIAQKAATVPISPPIRSWCEHLLRNQLGGLGPGARGKDNTQSQSEGTQKPGAQRKGSAPARGVGARTDGDMNRKPLIDPIEHAWRHCNPDAPLPSPLARGAVLSTKGPVAEPPSRTPDEAPAVATHEPHRRRPRHQTLR
jgi:hypothetical protein